jgi:hypothetical protein
MRKSNKYHMTQSLLNDWQRVFTAEDGYEGFIKSLNRIPKTPTDAMLLGIEFEGVVNSVLDGAYIPSNHKWYNPIMELKELLDGSQQQVSVKRDIYVDGVCFQLHGVLDFLKAGIIYDTKFSKHYYMNKYLHSAQHPSYFYLIPEAYEFQYLSCDGEFVYKEIYRPEDTTPIEVTIRQFMQWLEKHHLIETYTSIWNLESYYESKKKEKK